MTLKKILRSARKNKKAIVKVLLLEMVLIVRYPLVLLISFLLMGWYSVYMSDIRIQEMIAKYGELMGFLIALFLIANILDRLFFSHILPKEVDIEIEEG